MAILNNREMELRIVGRMATDPEAVEYFVSKKHKAEYFDTDEAKHCVKLILKYGNGALAIGFVGLKILIGETIEEGRRDSFLGFVSEAAELATDDGDFGLATDIWSKRMAVERYSYLLRESMKLLQSTGDPAVAQQHTLQGIAEEDDQLVVEDLRDIHVRAEKRAVARARGQRFVIPTPWPTLNLALDGGTRDGEIFVIAGQTGRGKSFCADQIGVHGAVSGFNVLKITIENKMEQSIGRSEALYHDIDYRELQNNSPSIDTAALQDIAYSRSAVEGKHWTIHLFTGDYGIGDAISIIERWRISQKFDPHMVIIDSPDLLDKMDESVPAYAKSKYNYLIRHIWRGLMKWNQARGKSVIATSQVSNDDLGTGKNKKSPTAGIVADSKDKSRIADNMIVLEQTEAMKKLRCTVAHGVKWRDGKNDIPGFVLQRCFQSPRFREVIVEGDTVRPMEEEKTA